jgi:hypothetical protein
MEHVENDGENNLLWTDPWSDRKPCAYKFPILFELCEDKELTVKEFHRQKGVVRISGRR